MKQNLIFTFLLISISTYSSAKENLKRVSNRKPNAQECRTTDWKFFGSYWSAKVVDGKIQRFETSEELVDTWSANYNFYDIVELRGNWKDQETKKVKVQLFKDNEKTSISEKKFELTKEKPQVGAFKELVEYPLSENRVLLFEIYDDKGVYCESRVKLNALD